MRTRNLSIVLLVSFLSTDVSFGFQAPFSPRSHGRLPEVARHDTSLNMGLRSFLKKKLGREEGGSIKDTAASRLPHLERRGSNKSTAATEKKSKPATAAAPKAAKAPVNKPAPKPAAKQAAATSNESKKARLPPLHTESVKEKLTRVRSGKMTEDEKEAFLRTALSAKETSRKPLRQKLPPDDRTTARPAANGNATPFPKDSLLKNVASGWGNSQNNTDPTETPLRTWKDGTQLEDQKKKREYFDMVTNPNRFHTYKSSVVTAPGQTADVPPVTHDGVLVPQIEEKDEETKEEDVVVVEDEQTVLEEYEKRVDDAGEDYERLADVTGDLGTRLEKAAVALEEAAKAREQERLEKEKRLAEQRLEQKRRLEEVQRKQQLELEKRELELKAKKREEEEALAREQEKRRREEEARQRKLMEAQDEYWAKKLKAERDAKMKGMSQEQKNEFVRREALEQEALEQEKALEAYNEAKMDVSAPKETDVVVQAQIDETAAAILSQQKKQEPFEEKQARKRQEMERAQDEQIARLKALNSPLPSPVSPAAPKPSPVVPQARPAARRGASEYSKLMNPPPAPAPAATLPVKEPKSEPTVAQMMSTVEEDVEIETPKKDEEGFFSRVLGNKKKDSSSPESAKKEPPRPEKRRVVRQKLPLGDDFDSFARDSPNQQMSIGDAMSASGASLQTGDQEQRSKMWGVDMSRIAKSLEEEEKGKN